MCQDLVVSCNIGVGTQAFNPGCCPSSPVPRNCRLPWFIECDPTFHNWTELTENDLGILGEPVDNLSVEPTTWGSKPCTGSFQFLRPCFGTRSKTYNKGLCFGLGTFSFQCLRQIPVVDCDHRSNVGSKQEVDQVPVIFNGLLIYVRVHLIYL